jgi:hypothetical protein
MWLVVATGVWLAVARRIEVVVLVLGGAGGGVRAAGSGRVAPGGVVVVVGRAGAAVSRVRVVPAGGRYDRVGVLITEVVDGSLRNPGDFGQPSGVADRCPPSATAVATAVATASITRPRWRKQTIAASILAFLCGPRRTQPELGCCDATSASS